MEDAIFSPASMAGALNEYDMDFCYMDELFLGGCWLETTDGSDFLGSSNSSSLFEPFFRWPAMDTNCGLNTNVPQKDGGSPLLFEAPEKHFAKTSDLGEYSENCTFQGSELGRRWWIGPRANPGAGSSVMDRLIKAVGYINDLERDKDVLIQVWIPENRGSGRVLRTSELAFSMNSSSERLAKYRDISVSYQFSAEENSKEGMGLPSRVFLGKIPEWSPDVQFFRTDEYARVDFAQQCGVRGTLALPVFDQGNKTCVGVIEVVMTTQQIKYSSELEIVCKALEAVDLRSSNVLGTPNAKVYKGTYEALFPEIREVLGFACETHKLPLAQTWISCSEQGNVGCHHSDEKYIDCVSTVEEACYVADPFFKAFHEACSEHHLLKGQGIAGKAFTTNGPCFSSDIRSFGNTEYPLSHHARMFGLQAAVAIRLRSIQSAKTDFVLEFFLPIHCTDFVEQKDLLTSLSLLMQEYFQSLRVITDEELTEEVNPQRQGGTDHSNDGACRQEVLKEQKGSHLEWTSYQYSSPTNCLTNGDNVSLFSPEKPGEVFTENSSGHNTNLEGFSECTLEGSTLVEDSLSKASMGRRVEKRRMKGEKTISLPTLQKYFAGSLKDAAKSLGVCPTTLKRICRQHGIKRWPSRKIKKVGHSLQKLQVVIDSVKDTSGSTFQIDSFYTNLSELGSPNMGGIISPPATKVDDNHPQTTTSKSLSSSCSQSSSSSHCYSSRTKQQQQQHHLKWNNSNSNDSDSMVGDDNSGGYQMKRVRSEAHLSTPNQDGTIMPRSKSHRNLGDSTEDVLRSPKNSKKVTEEEEDSQRIKVTCGSDKIRFRMHKEWGWKELIEEIRMRFSIQDISVFDIKYLDDDFEWVLLTCDADLEECLYVYRLAQRATIKISIQLSRHQCR